MFHLTLAFEYNVLLANTDKKGAVVFNVLFSKEFSRNDETCFPPYSNSIRFERLIRF